jgi:hypothetical protein
MIQEIEIKRKENLEMQQFIRAKQKHEKLEMLKFKENEIAEMKRLKQLEKQQKRLEFMDEVARNIEKSQLIRSESFF